MQKITKIALFVSIVFNIGLLIAIFTRQTPVKLREIRRIDTLYVYRDSIQHQIDSIIQVVKVNENNYRIKRETVINNSPTDDYIFFSEYIRLYDGVESADKDR